VDALPGYLQRLPPGHDPQLTALASRSQRERMLDAIAELVAKRGYRGTTIEHIVKRAGVARSTFYENFDNREACLLAAFDAAVEETRHRILAATAGEREWPEQVRRGLLALIDSVVAEPALARTCLVESMTAGPDALARYEAALQSFTPFFARGREFCEEGEALPETLEDSLVGGVVWMIHQRLLRGQIEEIAALLPTMLEFVLAPYLGEERAAALAAGPA
jgi:AcrR family transcriptional regulator